MGCESKRVDAIAELPQTDSRPSIIPIPPQHRAMPFPHDTDPALSSLAPTPSLAEHADPLTTGIKALLDPSVRSTTEKLSEVYLAQQELSGELERLVSGSYAVMSPARGGFLTLRKFCKIIWIRRIPRCCGIRW